MQPFGEWIMRSRRNAVLVALICSVLPFFSWLSIIVMALVTLRRGQREGAVVLAAVLLPQVALLFVTKQIAGLAIGVGNGVLIYVLALVLRNSARWSTVLITTAVIAMIVVLGLHHYIDNINLWWEQKMLAYMQALQNDASVDVTSQQQTLQSLARFATGLQAALLMLVTIVWLMIGRYWQALLYNPGQLQPELHNIRLPVWSALVFIVLGVLAWSIRVPLLIDMMPILVVPFMIAGLSMIHYWIKAKGLNGFWLVLCYGALILLTPYMVMLVVLIALIDSATNLRARTVTQK